MNKDSIPDYWDKVFSRAVYYLDCYSSGQPPKVEFDKCKTRSIQGPGYCLICDAMAVAKEYYESQILV